MSDYKTRFVAGEPIEYLDDQDNWQPAFVIVPDSKDWHIVLVSPFPWTERTWYPGSPLGVAFLHNVRPRTEDQP